ncbi:MAG: PTS sugar transporter subunit IIA [Anaerolineaceae bacterium]|nr:PTS sugar transporter subunit IIA [Anaerolineaceae bacterium]
MKKERILTQAEAADWQSAVRLVGNLLEQDGCISADYTQQMIEAILTLGPYIVILPGFALCHAAPSKAVLQDGISLVTLKSGVEFGSPNDPVTVCMGLCSRDGKAHMAQLQKLAAKLMEPEVLERIKEANDSEIILNLFEET